MGDGGSRGPIWQPEGDKYTRLDRDLQSANSQFIEEQQTQQQVIQFTVWKICLWEDSLYFNNF